MSVVISYVSENIAIIATDTRVSYGENREFGYSDNEQKLINLSFMGWAAGTGLTQFLDPFKEKLSNSRVTHTTQIEEIFLETIKETNEKYPYFKTYIEESVAIFSWIGLRNNSDKKSCRLGIVSMKNFGARLAYIQDNYFYILYPSEYGKNQSLIDDMLKNHNLIYEYKGNVRELLSKIFKIFKHISDNTNDVSKICDVGVCVINNNNVCKFNIKDNIDELVNAKELKINIINTYSI